MKKIRGILLSLVLFTPALALAANPTVGTSGSANFTSATTRSVTLTTTTENAILFFCPNNGDGTGTPLGTLTGTVGGSSATQVGSTVYFNVGDSPIVNAAFIYTGVTAGSHVVTCHDSLATNMGIDAVAINDAVSASPVDVVTGNSVDTPSDLSLTANVTAANSLFVGAAASGNDASVDATTGTLVTHAGDPFGDTGTHSIYSLGNVTAGSHTMTFTATGDSASLAGYVVALAAPVVSGGGGGGGTTTNAVDTMITDANTGFASTTGFDMNGVVSWSAGLLKLFIGSGVAVIFGLRGWIAALALIGAVIYFAYRAFRFFRH